MIYQMPKKGDHVRIAQDSYICEYSKNDKTLYFKERLPKTVLAIYLRKFIEYNENMCEIIIGDKIVYVAEKDLREIKNDQTGKICIYHGTNSDL